MHSDVDSPPVGGRRGTRMAAALVFVLLLFLGALWAAVAQMTGHCHIHRNYLAVDHTPGSSLDVEHGSPFLVGDESRRCEVSAWDVRFEVPFWAEEMLRKLGVRFFYT